MENTYKGAEEFRGNSTMILALKQQAFGAAAFCLEMTNDIEAIKEYEKIAPRFDALL